MGLKCGNVVNYLINDLSFIDLIWIVESRKQRRFQCSSNIIVRPMIDIDASWLIRRCVNMSFDQRVNSLIRLCLLFINNGCCVCIICDGPVRHHTKRSTTKRLVDCYRNKIDFRLKKFLILLSKLLVLIFKII